VFENRVLRRIFVPKREEVKGAWRKLRNEVTKSRRIGWAAYVACIGAFRNSRLILARNREEKKQLRRPIYRWKDNIKINSTGSCEKGNESSSAIKCGTNIGQLSEY
jgi:hypothetical protein